VRNELVDGREVATDDTETVPCGIVFRSVGYRGVALPDLPFDAARGTLLNDGGRLLDEAGVCASAASACASGAMEPSHVLAAMGVPNERARGALRLTLGRTTTADEIGVATTAIVESVRRLRKGRAA